MYNNYLVRNLIGFRYRYPPLTARGQDNIPGYADNLRVASCSAAGVTRTHSLTLLWASALCMKLNASKSFGLGNMQLKIRNQILECVQNSKILGNVVNFRQEKFEKMVSLPASRIFPICIAHLARISRLPGQSRIV